MENKHVSQRLKALRTRADYNMAEFSKKLGYATPSGYQRYEDETLFRFPHLPPNLMQKIFPVLVGAGDPAITEAEVLALGPPETAAILKPRRAQIPVIGRVAAGLWQEDDQLAQEPLEYIPFTTDSRYPEREQYALKVDGESMNVICPNGSYVVVLRDFGRELREDDVLIVQRKKAGLTERTIKRFKMIDGKPWLVPQSSDTKFKPIEINGDEETVIEIEGFALGVYNPF